MSDDLDLRAIDRRHAPDPRFVAALGEQLDAILSSSPSADASTDEEGSLTLDLEPGPPPRRRSGHRRRRVFAAAAVLAAASVAAFAVVVSDDRGSREDSHVFQGGSQANGWVAFTQQDDGGDLDVYLVRDGEPPRRVAGSDADGSDQGCPAFSPDGGELVFGQTTGGSSRDADAELVISEVSGDGSTSGTTAISVDGMSKPPCAIWSPDGRWVAFGAGSEVWLVDTVTEERRRLRDYYATDLDWRPGTDELAFVDDGIHIYSVTTGEVRSIGFEDARLISWSPDGSTIAVQDEHMSIGLSLVDADGTNERGLTQDHLERQGIGPAWSPDGRWVAYQRLVDGAGWHEVVLVAADETGGDLPFGTEVVIPAPMTPGIDRPWSPWSVTWSPDGSALLYNAWTKQCSDGADRCTGLIAVPVDTTKAPVLLVEGSQLVAHHEGQPWLPTQTWGRQPPG